MWCKLGTNPTMCAETLDQFFFYVLQSSVQKERERERDSTFTTEVNALTYLDLAQIISYNMR